MTASSRSSLTQTVLAAAADPAGVGVPAQGNGIERVPQTWTTADEAFFAVTARMFARRFLDGAGVLLAGNDELP